MSCGVKDLREGLGGKAGRELVERKPRGAPFEIKRSGKKAVGRSLQTMRILERGKICKV